MTHDKFIIFQDDVFDFTCCTFINVNFSLYMMKVLFCFFVFTRRINSSSSRSIVRTALFAKEPCKFVPPIAVYMQIYFCGASYSVIVWFFFNGKMIRAIHSFCHFDIKVRFDIQMHLQFVRACQKNQQIEQTNVYT